MNHYQDIKDAEQFIETLRKLTPRAREEMVKRQEQISVHADNDQENLETLTQKETKISASS